MAMRVVRHTRQGSRARMDDGDELSVLQLCQIVEENGRTWACDSRNVNTEEIHDMTLRARDLETKKDLLLGKPLKIQLGSYREVCIHRQNGAASLGGTCLRESSENPSAVVACEVLGRLHCSVCRQVEERTGDLARAKAENLDVRTSVQVNKLLKLCPDMSVSKAVEITRDDTFQSNFVNLPVTARTETCSVPNRSPTQVKFSD